MKKDLLALLACPKCRHSLETTDAVSEGDDIVSGELVCGGCGSRYSIENGVPDLRLAEPESARSNR